MIREGTGAGNFTPLHQIPYHCWLPNHWATSKTNQYHTLTTSNQIHRWMFTRRGYLSLIPPWHNPATRFAASISVSHNKLTLQGWCQVLMLHITHWNLAAPPEQFCCCETSNWLAHDSHIRAGEGRPQSGWNEGWGWWSSWLTYLKPGTAMTATQIPLF